MTKMTVLATPAARRIAKERGIDLSQVKGTGEYGSIKVEDINNYKQQRKATPVARKMAEHYQIDINEISTDKQIIKKQDVVNYLQQTGKLEEESKPGARKTATGRREKIVGMRKVIADNMQQSMQTAPQYTMTSELDTTKLVKLIDSSRDIFKEKTEIKLTFTDFIIKITALAVREHPILNAAIDGEEIVYHDQVNMGLAVALEDGLIVPVVKNAAKSSLREIAKARKDLVKRAREGKLQPDEYSGGTFTITNTGMYPVDYSTPIINQPESAILGVGRTVEKPVIIDDEIKKRSMTGFSITLDHRIIDGIVGAQFFATLKELLENPLCVLV